MLLKRSSLAFLIYLASMANSSPLNSTLSAPGNASAVQATDPTSSPVPFHELRTIDERCAILANGAIAISSVVAVATYLTSVIKEQSDKGSCAVISGTIENLHYQYSAQGRNCDTTSESKTVNKAVNDALNFMVDQKVDAACFELTHGGTWKGYLQVAGPNEQIIQNKCISVNYNIEI